VLTGTPFERLVLPYLRTFFSTLQRGLVADLWAEPTWLWRGGFDQLLGAPPGRSETNIGWAAVRLDWLREGAKELSKRHLKAGTRTWATIQNWRRALIPFADFLIEEGLLEPTQVDRQVFLDYLAFVREGGATKGDLERVTIASKILEGLVDERIVEVLPTSVFLRHGENSVNKTKAPKPYPPDVVERIDTQIIVDPDIDPTLRCMLRLLRWGCPRVSELVSLPIECLQHNGAGGYWVEYWQFKTKAWRRFPIPNDLAEDIRAQQDRVRRAYPADHEILFPARARSNQHSGIARGWSSHGFRDAVRRLFVKHQLVQSSMTGEVITGGEIHRYRHTVGTALLNNDWTQPEVQEFFGHASPTMTSHYGKVLHSTLERKAKAFHEAQELERQTAGLPVVHPTVEHLRTKFTAVLANGLCQLPASMKCDFRPNPCNTCSFFDPGGDEFALVHAGQRERLTLHIAELRSTPDTAALALNEAALAALNQRLGTQRKADADD
jgi:integrase